MTGGKSFLLWTYYYITCPMLLHCCPRRRRRRLALPLLLLLALYAWHLESRAPPSPPSPLRRRASPRAPPAAPAPPSALSAAPPPATLVYVCLGDTHFQSYLLESIWQARIFNPASRVLLVADEAWLGPAHPWVPALEEARVERIPYARLADNATAAFGEAYERLWDELGRRVGAMQPTLNHRTNMAFTQMTMLRLAALRRLVDTEGLTRVVHVENDQMLYGSIDALADAADACGAALAMTRVGARMAPAVLYAASAPPLGAMLDFIEWAVRAGPDTAANIARSTYATDMSLSAAFFDYQREQGNGTLYASLPGMGDGECIAAHSGMLYDAAGLGTWVAGDFYQPKSFFSVRLGESAVRYWELPFEWRVENGTAPAGAPAAGGAAERGWDGLRRPFVNGTLAFNMHIHSKQLHLWSSRDREMHKGMLAVAPERN